MQEVTPTCHIEHHNALGLELLVQFRGAKFMSQELHVDLTPKKRIETGGLRWVDLSRGRLMQVGVAGDG